MVAVRVWGLAGEGKEGGEGGGGRGCVMSEVLVRGMGGIGVFYVVEGIDLELDIVVYDSKWIWIQGLGTRFRGRGCW